MTRQPSLWQRLYATMAFTVAAPVLELFSGWIYPGTGAQRGLGRLLGRVQIVGCLTHNL